MFRSVGCGEMAHCHPQRKDLSLADIKMMPSSQHLRLHRAEGRILQAVGGSAEHRLSNYNIGPWEQWEHDATHGLVNSKWRKPLGFGLQMVQTALFDDLKVNPHAGPTYSS